MKVRLCLDFTYGCLLDGGEHAGRFDNVLGAGLPPWDRLRFALAENDDLVSVYDETIVFGLDLSLELTVGGIILEHVDHVIETNEGVINSNDLVGKDLGLTKCDPIACGSRLFFSTYLATALQGSSQHETADTAKSVNSDFAHIVVLIATGKSSKSVTGHYITATCFLRNRSQRNWHSHVKQVRENKPHR